MRARGRAGARGRAADKRQALKAHVVGFDFAQGIPGPYRRARRHRSMNQTESGCKAEGSGVGILGEMRPATSARSAASAMGEPRLQLCAYLTAPDRNGCKWRGAKVQPFRMKRSVRKIPAGRPQFFDVACVQKRRVRKVKDNRRCSMDVHSNPSDRPSPVVSLSPREQECLQWVSRGKSSADIGVILTLSPRTVDSYLEKVCSKFRVRTRIEAVAAAVRQGLVDPG